MEVCKLVKDWTINDSYYLVGIMREPNLARLDKAVENARKKRYILNWTEDSITAIPFAAFRLRNHLPRLPLPVPASPHPPGSPSFSLSIPLLPALCPTPSPCSPSPSSDEGPFLRLPPSLVSSNTIASCSDSVSFLPPVSSRSANEDAPNTTPLGLLPSLPSLFPVALLLPVHCSTPYVTLITDPLASGFDSLCRAQVLGPGFPVCRAFRLWL